MTTARRDITFRSGTDDCAAWLYGAEPAGAPKPLVIMGHGLGAVREMRLDAYAERFAARGWAVLVFDYRHLGASGGEPRQLLDIGRQLADWHAALACARTLPGIDHGRIALWGSSFGGGHVLRIAAEDGAVAAVVAQCPFTDGPASLRSRLRTGFPSALALTAAGLADAVAARFGARPVLVPMAGAAWMPAFLVSPDALSGASALLPPGTRVSARASGALRRLPRVRARLADVLTLTGTGRLAGRDSIWGVLTGPDDEFTAANALSARLVLRLPLYRPGRDLRRGTTPTLLCVCDADVAAPAATTERYAAGLPHVEVRNYPCGHFGIYVGVEFERAVADQIDFLAARLS
ncbi:alpha/beta hydrolase [Nocardia sp. NPDC057227]|uniref:alpha/beta hydrolase n=1 Tax=Nocardia sp. NPDC057227 TaxID=3346056 RepID=UPI003629AD3A